MTTGRSARDVCLGVLDGAEAHDYGSGFGSPGVARIGSPQAAKLTDDLLAALAEAGYVVVRAEEAAPVASRERVAKVLNAHYYDAGWSKEHQGFRCVCGWLGENHVQHVTDMLAADVFRDAASVVTDETVAVALAAWNKAYWSERTPGKRDWMRAALEAALLAGGDQ